jgi:mono/diheme cytochrome c family protein
VNAVRLAERWLTQKDKVVQGALLKRLNDKDWTVRRQLAATLGELPNDAVVKLDALTTLLERHGDDPITVDAALSGLAGAELVMLRRLLSTSAQAPQRATVLTTLAATIVRSRQDEPLREVLQLGAENDRVEWQRAALLRGAEAALLNTPLPGSGRRGGGGGGAAATAGANSAPGSRGGPGGAPAFPGSQRGDAPARGRGAALAAVPVTREPSGLIALAETGGEMGDRAKALLARLTWPGKLAAADAAPAAKPLTAAEQQRFEAGKTVYTTLCIACHQEDGQGREKVAPTLVGSDFAVGAAGAAIRILLNGKEGSVGLMPPLGSALTDTQIASVLTYVRRSWGHEASAVDEPTVASVRKETSGRTRPWTEKELGEVK